ncbi:Rossmann-like and DUF2520 domain-containing protein [Robiginitalea sp. SC105]|uniref:Rossmann-like and DUF2520 domain-containing protein n=1 Tax=Robiginitalea sp. SC105 TaxID=2762332 RepID=UPI00163B492A|nr:Rossmann-like and DUF2520 domain-containing protein [Robiginitalea sp. SC105]MBC2840393.1 DUF2520 domain-containing protein [Robiginitalea sp. SC105]
MYFSTVIRVVLIGSGNLAYHLSRALAGAQGVALQQICARHPERLDGFPSSIPRVGLDAPAMEADIILLAVSDRAIGEVAAGVKNRDALIVHCSGAQPLETLGNSARQGVFYPLQTFTRGRALDFNEIPVLIEAGSDRDLKLLADLAGCLGMPSREADSQARLKLHLAAVFVNNFTNHMVYLGEQTCKEAGLDPAVLQPLLLETISKLGELPARDAQTGPARRGDQATLDKHRKLLKGHAGSEIYEVITQSIQSTYETEL